MTYKIIKVKNKSSHINRFILFVLLFISIRAQAQSNISGIIKDSLDKRIENVNVLLLRTADSGLVKGILSDSKGAFLFHAIQAGEYFIRSTYNGYKTDNSLPFSIVADHNPKEMGIIHLHEMSSQLEEVKVVVKKPFLELKPDRLVINVENSITSAGSTALQILERSPGVIVDHQNNTISMNGKDGVILMINGKISRVPVAAVVQMLDGMSSNNIEKIELITTPPANFDAGGNAGYINIVLKENNNIGTNGSYNVSLGYGKGLVTAAGMNFNHRKDKLNIYGDLSYSRIKGPFKLKGYSKISNDGNIFENHFATDRTDTTIQLNGRLGVDYQLSKRTVAGILLTGDSRHFNQSEQSNIISLKNGTTDTLTTSLNHELNDWTNFGINLNSHQIYTENKNLTLNLDYNKYKNNQPVNYAASYFNGAGDPAYDRITRSGKNTHIDFWVGALDYQNKIGKISLETGLKQTFSGFKNDVSFEKQNQSTWIKDAALSANYTLNENYSAGYVSVNVPVTKNTEAKMGLRYEYTNSNLHTEVTKNLVDRHYGNLFPTIYLSHTLNENNSVNFSFNTRINRPAFTDLAPFTYYIDANTVITGNPALQPSITNTVKGDYIFKSYLFSISYSVEDHAISGFQPETDSATLKTILTPKNLKNQKIISAVLSLPFKVNNWWSMQFNLTGLWQQVNAIYQKEAVRLNSGNINIYGNQQVTLPEKFSFELSGFYQSESLSGLGRLKAFGSLDIGLKKKMGERSSLQFSGSDILNTFKFRFITNLPEQNLVSNVYLRFSHSTYKLTFTHNFGKQKLTGKRERSTGAEEEKGRVST